MLSDLKKAEDIKGVILKAIILVGIVIVRRLAFIKLLVILLKGLRLNLVVLRPIIIKFRGSSY